jgi:subtilisin family serine protease
VYLIIFPKRFSLFLIALIAALSFCTIAHAAAPVSSRVSPGLFDRLTAVDGSATVEVIVYIDDGLELAGLDNSLRLAAADKKKRHSEVVNTMLATTGQTQAPIIELLEQGAASGAVDSYQTFWVNNSIVITARASFVTGLSTREEIEYITLDRIHYRKDPLKQNSRITAIPHPDTLRAQSYPIRTLELDKLWDRGLTGKGVLVCAIGSGIDGSHALLGPKWRGQNGGTSAESWFDPVDGSTFPFDDEPVASHGTGVMGIMVAGERNLGVAYDAQWIGAKIFDNQNLTPDGASSTKDSWLIAAFQWALDPDGNPETIVDVPDVINNSYGTTGEYNEDICRQVIWRMIDNVEAAGTVVIFSAGNEGPDPWTTGSPASRTESPVNVFAVGSVDSTGRISSFSSRGPSACDSFSIKPTVCGPGQRVPTILSSEYGLSYRYIDGTSFSAPYVAGLVALIRQANPTLTPDEIKYLIIDSADDRGLPGPDFAYGYGVIDPVALFESLPLPNQPILYSKRIEAEDTTGGNGNGYLEQGERIQLVVPVFNSGTTITDVTARLRTSSPGIVLVDTTADYGDIAQFEGASNTLDPFVIDVALDAEAGGQLVLLLDLIGSGGQHTQTLQLTLPIAPAVQGLAVHDAGSFRLSLTNYGQFGGGIGNGKVGESLRYPADAEYAILHRGALLLGTSSLKVSDGIAENDWVPGPGGPIKFIENSPRADQMTVGYTEEKSAGTINAIGVKLKQTTMAWRDSPDNDFVIIEYDIRNPHAGTINNVYVGLYADWDIPDSIPTRNAVGWNEALNLSYVQNPQESSFPVGGLALVSDHRVSGARAVSNWQYVHTNYSDNLFYAFMSGGTALAASDSLDDWSTVVASGPHSIPPGETLRLAWAVVVGDNEADLIANTQAAHTRYSGSLALAGEQDQSRAGPGLPRAFSLSQNAPNPFNPSTTVSYSVPEDTEPLRVKLTVYDIRGRTVAVLADRVQDGGNYTVNWDGTDKAGRQVASGIYFYRLRAGSFTATRKMVMLK